MPDSVGKSLAPVASAAPGLARVTGTVALNASLWGAKTYVKTSLRLAKAAVDPGELAALAHDAAEVLEVVIGVTRSMVPSRESSSESGDPAARNASSLADSLLAPLAAPSSRRRSDASEAPLSSGTPDSDDDSPTGLKRRGAELLERSRDVWRPEQGHPAYGRILDELAPDEARILLHLLQDGPQPSVDVRTGGMRSGSLIAPGLSMIGARAGVRYGEQVPAYLNNLSRLGLVWFSKEALRDAMEYQVLEAQPDVLEALHTVRMAKVVRRSIQLTPFGIGFCKACLIEDATQHFPEHSSPLATEESEPPKQS